MKSKIVLATLVACLIPVSSLASTSKINQKKIDTIKLMYSQAEGVDDTKLLYMYGSKNLRKALDKYNQFNDLGEHPSCTEIYPSIYDEGIPREDVVSNKASSYKILKNGRVRVTINKKTMTGKTLKYRTDFSLYCPSSSQCKITNVYSDGKYSLRKDINQLCNAYTI